MHTSNNERARARTICEHKTGHILIEERRVEKELRKRGGKKEEREKDEECMIDSMFM